MITKILFTLSATLLGVGLARSPLSKYRLFHIIMEFLGSGGAF